MELIEPIDVLNSRLIDYFGVDTLSGSAIWRIVFSEDQLEKRKSEFSEGGIALLTPIIIEVPKYKQWISQKYILEQLVIVPDYQQDEVQTKMSYEPFYVFADKNDGYLPPKWEVAQFLIDTSLALRGKKSMKRYSDSITNQEEELVAREKRISDMIEYFGGDESGLMGATHNSSGNGVFVPQNYQPTDKTKVN